MTMRIHAITGTVLLLATIGQATAAEIYWEGDTDTDFNNALNWAGDSLPGTGDVAAVQNGAYDVRLNASPTNAPTEIWLGNDGGGGGLTMTDGIVDTAWFAVGRYGSSPGSDGVFTMSGGTINAAHLVIRESGCSGSATLSGDAVFNSSDWAMIGNGWDAGGTLGSVTLEGSAQLDVGTDFNVGDWGVATAALTIRDDAIVRAAQSGGALYIGKWDDAVGTVNQDGGRFEAWGGDARIGGNGGAAVNAQGIYNLTNGVVVIHPNFQLGAYGKGTFNQYGGVVTNEGWMAIGRYAGSVGVYNLMGGSLTKAPGRGAALIVGENGNGTLNISGNSLLRVTGQDLRVGNIAGAQGTLRITGSTATIDVAGYANLRYNAGATTTFEVMADAGGISPINTGGDVHLNGCALTADLSAISPAQDIVLINNGSTNAVNGIFAHLPEGAVVAGASGRAITYTGGDGNDVVLIHEHGSGLWTGAVDNDFNVAGNWTGDTFPTVLASIQNGDTNVMLDATPTHALGELWVGNAGSNAALTQTDGALVVSNSMVVGRYGGIDGAKGRYDLLGGSIMNSGTLMLGQTGNCEGTLIMSNAAAYTGSGYVAIGIGSGSTGTMVIASNALFTSDTGDFNVSDWGTSRGTLYVKDNATLNATRTSGQVFVGKNDTSRGWLYQSGGTVNVRVSNFGSQSGAEGTVDLSGGTYHGSAWMNIAIFGTATVTVRNNARLLNDGDLNVADNSGQATLNIQDNAYVRGCQAGGGFYVGKNGTGVGVVNQTGGIVEIFGNQESRIGGINVNASGAQGTYNISAGSLVVSHNLQVGAYGTGTLNQAGGTVASDGWLAIGRFAGGVGTVNISGGALRKTLGAGQALIVGEAGSGKLNISSNAVVGVRGNLRMGLQPSATGALSIAGSEAAVDITGNLILRENASSATSLELLADAGGIAPLVVGGNVTLSNTSFTVDMSACEPSLTVTVIDNRGLNPVRGTFDGLSEGDIVPGTADRRITYSGGDGNNVRLLAEQKPGTTVIVQ
jgi:hypothetical protein